MGSRAVITASKSEDIKRSNDLGIYVHWNGGKDSITAFLTYCQIKGYREPSQDNYGWARLCQVIGNYLGGCGGIGIDRCCNLDCDNGVYIIKGWEIVGRQYFEGKDYNYTDLIEFLLDIDEAQPQKEQLGEEKISNYVIRGDRHS